jgi:hypothetical protein
MLALTAPRIEISAKGNEMQAAASNEPVSYFLLDTLPIPQ